MSDNSTRLLVVVPTYNERETIESLVCRVRESVPQAHILVVDDGSPDGTGQIADQLASEDPAIQVLHRSDKQGLGGAYRAGFAVGLRQGYGYLAEIDADGSHDPASLAPMFDEAQKDSDVVIGSRWVTGGSVANWSWYRQAISRVGNFYARSMLKSRVRDMTAGFRVYRSHVLKEIDLDTVSSNGFSFQVEMTWRVERLGGQITEHPITFSEREGGISKMGSGIVFEALQRIGLWGFQLRMERLRKRKRKRTASL